MVAAGTLMGAGAAKADQGGFTWTSQTSAADNYWRSVTYGNGLFVAVSYTGTGNRVMTSPDGITWTSRTSAADNQWTSVAYGNGLFVAVAASGSGNRVMTSPDGITWTSRTSAADNGWLSVTYGGGLFVAVAQGGTGNRVMTSGIFGGAATVDPTKWITIPQGLPLSATGTCDALDDKAFAYGTGLTGGWQRSWEPWVNTTLGANGQRIGGWACIRTLINKGGSTWMIAN